MKLLQSRTLSAFTLTFTFCLALATGGLALAQDDELVLETEEIKPVPGQQEHTLGVKVYSVEESDEGVKISVSVPQEIANGSQGNLEEVVVYGKRIEQDKPRPTLPQIKRYEVINNLEEGRSGIVLYLGKNEDFVLRFNYSDDRVQDGPNLLEN
ncbi:hypothetical protein [Halioxenophilus sp. WMMB6]|uniref:hypothetical protein n=1 Tax=Halioxenophilus sp. WMMB6 TaxID=3073815 RepID=UPI00295E443B|nr:hypothetical protein [Halioxenophilus sp. WMMB6]